MLLWVAVLVVVVVVVVVMGLMPSPKYGGAENLDG